MSHVLKILWDRPLKTVNSDKNVKQQAKVSWENISLKPIYFGYFEIVYAGNLGRTPVYFGVLKD